MSAYIILACLGCAFVGVLELCAEFERRWTE